MLLEVWREVCRHLEIRESVTRIAPLLAQQLPLDLLLVRRIDRDHSSVDTVAVGRPSAGPLPAATRTTCTAAMLGINPHTVRARMRKLGVEWSKYRSPRGRDTGNA